MSSRAEEYENHFWGFSAKELSVGVSRVVLENIQNYVNSLCKSAQKKIPEEKWPTLFANCQILLDEYSVKAAERLKATERYNQENFSIPSHILLKKDTVQRNQYSEEDKARLDEEIKGLKRRINRVHFLEYHLSQELEKHVEMSLISQKMRDLDLPPIGTLPNSKELQILTTESLGLEVEEANCHLKEYIEQLDYFKQQDPFVVCYKKRRLK